VGDGVLFEPQKTRSSLNTASAFTVVKMQDALTLPGAVTSPASGPRGRAPRASWLVSLQNLLQLKAYNSGLPVTTASS